MGVPLQKIALVGRSRPFLLCVILILVCFLWMHYVSPPGNIGIVFEEGNQSFPKGTYVDTLPARNSWQNVNDLPVRNTSQDREIKIDVVVSQKQAMPTESQMGKKCQRKKFDVSFLKVHKAGSTTLMNIFLRFAIENRLNIVLPRSSEGFGFNYLGYGRTVSKSKIVPLPANETYNILCNHVVYNKAAFRSIMPDDTLYVGIVREPVSHFSSAASYYGFYRNLVEQVGGQIPQDQIISDFLKNPAQVRLQTYFVYNRMCFDFGIPKDKFHDDRYVEAYIEDLDRDYELVLILERFQESLVLMKRILCWETKDILYVPLNAMGSKPDFDLNDNDVENLKRWNSADFKLYDHFTEVFNAKVESLGEDFQEEVESFKSIQEEVKDFCNEAVRRTRITTSVLSVPETKWGKRFTVSLEDCKLMMEPELSMMKRLIDNAWERYNKWLASKKPTY